MALQEAQTPQEVLRVASTKLAYTVQGAQEATGLGRSTIFLLISQKKLKTIKIGKRTLIPADSLRGFLASLEMEAA